MEYSFGGFGPLSPVFHRFANTVVRHSRTNKRIKKPMAVAVAQTPSFIPEIFFIIINLSAFVNSIFLLNFYILCKICPKKVKFFKLTGKYRKFLFRGKQNRAAPETGTTLYATEGHIRPKPKNQRHPGPKPPGKWQ
ncbi:hypothetical protein [Subdoligranulum variabile]|uniref:hypothetical protein n=1 Tax=Subdoligranulum variabile TaxID=214851 RepID=UPI0026E9EBD8|nr:hypothetical protein [Subdoligranulum variabile]